MTSSKLCTQQVVQDNIGYVGCAEISGKQRYDTNGADFNLVLKGFVWALSGLKQHYITF